jgi:hypothetical protein
VQKLTQTGWTDPGSERQPDRLANPMRAQRLTCLQLPWIGAALILAGWVFPAQAQDTPLEPTLDVGVVQRFGNSPQDEVVLKPAAGDSITLKLGQEPAQTITTTGDIKLKLEMQPQPDPKVTERVILSTHRSFESAEDSATQWKTQGIEVEVAQPRQWQVWAKRDTYKTPLLRRLLMQNLQSNGLRTAFIDTQVQTQIPKAAVTINGASYQQDNLEFDSTTDQVEVTFNREEHGTRSYAGSLKPTAPIPWSTKYRSKPTCAASCRMRLVQARLLPPWKPRPCWLAPTRSATYAALRWTTIKSALTLNARFTGDWKAQRLRPIEQLWPPEVKS